LSFAAIEITSPDDMASRDYIIEHLHEFDLAIFISPTAVEESCKAITNFPAALKLVAIGSKTAQAIEDCGYSADIVADGHDSESLLQHKQLHGDAIAGKHIVIFRGVGGRELLAEALGERGASVSYAEMYQRSRPVSADEFNQLLEQADILTVSSKEGLQNLYDLATDKQALTRLPVVVPGERAQALAQALDFDEIRVADNATDEACLNAIKCWHSQMGEK
jgi:uroporphyrinogen-III synthase